eukprot:g17283.t1
MISAHLAACVETTFDVVFFVEFCCRIMTAPSKRSYVLDPLNWADLFSAAGLPLRASVGFLVYPALQEKRNVQLILLLFLPIVRFLKLLRYFETFRLLIHAARSAIDALPVLVYIMIVITLVAATAIYLVESRGNIPTMHHSLWLAIVTMTTVGYIAASILTFVSVLFLALPVGIIGNEFTACWQSRHQVLLKTRVRKCLLKWGYTARDLQVLIQYVDVDEDGFLTLSEFLELIQQTLGAVAMRVGISLEHAVDLFILFDTDQNGQIDHAEFLRQIFPEEYVQEGSQENSFTLFDVEIPEIHPISFKEASKNPGSINRADLGLLLRSGQLVFNGAMECCGKVDDSLPQNVVPVGMCVEGQVETTLEALESWLRVDHCVNELLALRHGPSPVPNHRRSMVSSAPMLGSEHRAVAVASSALGRKGSLESLDVRAPSAAPSRPTLGRGLSSISMRSVPVSEPGEHPFRRGPRMSQRSDAMESLFSKRGPVPRDSLTNHTAGRRQESEVSLGVTPQLRRKVPVRYIDLRMAWQNYAREQLNQELSDEGMKPLIRMMHRNRCDDLWELLDDPLSSRCAWWISQFLACIVMASVILSMLGAAEEEFLCRILSAPSKRSYLSDPLNWPDMVSATGLLIRGAAGFVVTTSMTQGSRSMVVTLFLLLPLIRFLKLLRYFESFRLLIDATRNSVEALPVLCYIMEERSNIPSIYHAMWLAIVTMTTVGYGDYFPTSLTGYIVASLLTFSSVLFLALPVGIIGHEFTQSWQQRGQVLLKNRIRRCMVKWGYSAKDLRMLIEYVDVDGDGVLALTEFLELMRQMRIGITAQSAIDLFMAFDDDANGYIDYDEFLRQIFPEEYVKDAHSCRFLPVWTGTAF